MLAVLVLSSPVFATAMAHGAVRELCWRVLAPDFDAVLALTLIKSASGDDTELLAWQRDWQQADLTHNCILQPTLWIALSAIWNDPRNGTNYRARALATARRLAPASAHFRAQVLMLEGARVALSDWGHPCDGVKLVRRALALNPAYLPAHSVARTLAKQNAVATGDRGCVDKILSRIAADGVHRANVTNVEFLCEHVDSITRTRFSLGSVQLGYVGWGGGDGRICNTGDKSSHNFVLRRLQGHERPLLLDVGAGVGQFALLAVHEPRLRVFAFEPGPQAGKLKILLIPKSFGR